MCLDHECIGTNLEVLFCTERSHASGEAEVLTRSMFPPRTESEGEEEEELVGVSEDMLVERGGYPHWSMGEVFVMSRSVGRGPIHVVNSALFAT